MYGSSPNLNVPQVADGDFKKDGSIAATGNFDLGANKITNLADPVAGTDAVTKQYLEIADKMRDPKESARVATTVAGVLATDYENGDTVDGIVLVTGNRILIKDQALAGENGIYTVNVSGAPTRADDFDTGDAVAGSYLPVEVGTTNSDTFWLCTSNTGSDVVDTDAIAFAQLSSAVLNFIDGLSKSGSNVSLDINGLTAETSADDADTIAIYDDSGAVQRKMTRGNFLSGLPRGYIDGFFSVWGSLTVNIGRGACRDISDTADIALAASLTKNIGVVWAEGNAVGGFPSGLGTAGAANTWYQLFLIKNLTTGVVDGGFDTSSSATNLLADATGYTVYRRIAWVRTDGAANLLKCFHERGDRFYWEVPVLDVNAANPGTAKQAVTLTVPPALGEVRVIVNVVVVSTTTDVLLTALWGRLMSDQAPSLTAVPLASMYINSTVGKAAATLELAQTGSGQITYRLDASDANTIVRIASVGWIDFRGGDVV